MDDGICYIKSEFLIPDDKPTKQNEKSAQSSSSDSNPLKRAATDDNDSGDKQGDSRKRGQNKKRPVYREVRTSNLCNSLFNGPSGECTHPNCIFQHDYITYMKHKPPDLGDTCYIYTVNGFCPRGLTCRFAKAHIDKSFNNLKAHYYEESAKPTTINGIASDLQLRLRRREYNFDLTTKIVKHYDKIRSEKSRIAREGANAKGDASPNKEENGSTEDKPIGCVIDTEEIKERDCERKKVDFHNKLLLSPLTTVGNPPFRRICKEYGADITCGEMACAVPIVKGLTQEWALTKRHESEDVFGVQLCGNSPQIITQAAQLLKENSVVDFVDLNIGCPIDLIYTQGGGSALIRRQNILEVIVKSCSTLLGHIPFTVKTRTGVYAEKSVAHHLLPKLEQWGAAAVTLHGRSREQRYTKNANWDYIEECASKVKNIAVIGNGDILNFEDYNKIKIQAPHVSSVMIGRGALIKPWLFKEIKDQKHLDPSSKERFEMLQKYVNYGLEHWGSDTKGVENTRRFLLEWQSFLYRYVPMYLLERPPQRINQRPQKYHGRDDLETLMSSNYCSDWIKLSEMLLGPVPDGFTFLPKHKANSY